MANERENGTSLKRTFLVWSWLGLLGAYTGTLLCFTAGLWFSGGFLRSLAPLATRGVDSFLLTAVLGTVLPLLLLALGCVRFYRYSVAVYEAATTDPSPEGERTTALPFFRSALGYLLAAWIVVLAFETLPVLLSVSSWGTRRT